MLWKRYVVNLVSFSLSDYKTTKIRNGCLGFQNNLKLIVTDKITEEKKDINIEFVISKTISADSDMILKNENFQSTQKIYNSTFEIKEPNNWIITGSFTVDGIIGYIYIKTNAI